MSFSRLMERMHPCGWMADYVALTARVKELEETRDAGRENFLTMQQTAATILKRAEALETRLAAAEEFIKSNGYWSDYQWELREAKP